MGKQEKENTESTMEGDERNQNPSTYTGEEFAEGYKMGYDAGYQAGIQAMTGKWKIPDVRNLPVEMVDETTANEGAHESQEVAQGHEIQPPIGNRKMRPPDIPIPILQFNVTKKKEKGGRIFKCDQCEYETTRRGDITRHQKRHLGQRNFACQLCE